MLLGVTSNNSEQVFSSSRRSSAALPDVSRRGLFIAGAVGVLAACGKKDAEPEAAGAAPSSAAPKTPVAGGSPSTTPTAVDTPPLPRSAEFSNGVPAGVGVLRYDESAERDWSDIERWYARSGRKRHAFDPSPRIHRVISGTRNESQKQLDLDELLLHGMVLENDVDAPDGVIVIAHHNVTRIRDGAVSIDGVVHEQPMMGIHAPEVPGDVLTWLLEKDGRVAEYDYKAISVEIIDDKPGEYGKLFTPLSTGKPLLVTYQCHPCGSLAQRRVVRHELVGSRWTDKKIAYV